MSEPEETGNWFWLKCTAPSGVHLWEIGEFDDSRIDEIDALVAAAKAELEFPEDWVEIGAPWGASIAPGRPFGCFTWNEVEQRYDVNEGVTVHDVEQLRRES